MNETLQQVFEQLHQADVICDEKFTDYERAYKALDNAKMLKYDIQADEAGEMIVTPLTAIMQRIENESSFVPDAKTKDERYQQLRAYLIETDAIYADCLRTLERSEIEVLNATRQKDVAEKDYNRVHTKVWVLKLEIESLLKHSETKNLSTQYRIAEQESENIGQLIDVEKWKNANLQKTFEIVKLEHENVLLRNQGIDTLEARLRDLEDATRPAVNMAKAMRNLTHEE